MAFTGVELVDQGFAALILRRVWLLLWYVLDAFPDIAVFFSRRLIVFVLTCFEVSCSIRYITFFIF